MQEGLLNQFPLSGVLQSFPDDTREPLAIWTVLEVDSIIIRSCT